MRSRRQRPEWPLRQSPTTRAQLAPLSQLSRLELLWERLTRSQRNPRRQPLMISLLKRRLRQRRSPRRQPLTISLLQTAQWRQDLQPMTLPGHPAVLTRLRRKNNPKRR